MKIVKFTAENIKRIVAVEITPEGNLIQITGKNGAGKSSVMDAIWWALAGTSHIQAQPIRKGETKARIRLDLGELIVERRFTPKGSTLFVGKADGSQYSSPQTILDSLLGALSFDPLEFSRMEPRDQYDALRRITKLDVDIDAMNAQNAGDFGKRTDINRDAKAKRAQADGIIIPPGSPAELVDESALLDEMQRASAHNSDIDRRKTNRENAEQQIADLERVARELEQQAEKLIARAKEKRGIAKSIQEKLNAAEALPQPIDIAALRQKIEAAKETNRFVGARLRRESLLQEATQLEAASTEITERMEARERAKSAAIQAARMPIDGLGFGAGCVLFNGVPFEQASDAEKLKVSLIIAIASNPKLKVIRIKDGSLLDDESVKAVAEIAKALDYQVWMERVDSSGQVGVVIEDGMVKPK